MPAQYVLRKATNGQFYFRLTAENNEPILASELYKSKDGAKKGIESVKVNSPNEARYVRETSADGKFYFLLRAANNEVIGKSEMYNSKQAMENGIQAVMRVGPIAALSDKTDAE